MDDKVFTEVIIPILGMTDTTVIMITTPPDKKNFFSEILGVTDANGNDIFMKYILTLICDRCIRKGCEDRCVHKMRLYLPKWKSVEKQDAVYQMLKSRLGTLMRETYGVDYHDHRSQFPQSKIEFMFSRDLWSPSTINAPKAIVIVCDPNAANSVTSSAMALFAVSLDTGVYTISGLAYRKCRTGPECLLFLREFCLALRHQKHTRDSWILFCPENNIGHEATFLAPALKDIHRHLFISQKGNDEYGWRTDSKSKFEQLMSAAHAVFYERVRFMEDWVCIGDRDDALEEFKDQISRYSDHELQANGRSKKIVSGCVNEEGKLDPKLNDDLALSFCMALRVAELLYEEKLPGFPYEVIWKK